VAIVTAKTRMARSDPPFDRPPAGLRRQGGCFRRAGHHGPVIENGFFYDFSYKRRFTAGRLAAIGEADGRTRRQMNR